MRAIHFYTLALLTCFTVGCSMKTDCEKVVDHIILVVTKDTAVPIEQRSGIGTLKSREILLEECYQSMRSDGGVECALAAKTLEAINACQKKMAKVED